MYKFGFIYHFSYSKIKASDQLTSIIKPLIAAPQCSIANWDRWATSPKRRRLGVASYVFRGLVERLVGGGDLDAPEVHLTDEGQIILKYIIGFEKVKGAHIDNFVIMPNHIHMIIRIDETDISSTRANEKIPRMVAAFKRFCNAEIGRDIFQRTYFDRVIRDEHDYEMIWNYIETNPAKWENDCFY